MAHHIPLKFSFLLTWTRKIELARQRFKKFIYTAQNGHSIAFEYMGDGSTTGGGMHGALALRCVAHSTASASIKSDNTTQECVARFAC